MRWISSGALILFALANIFSRALISNIRKHYLNQIKKKSNLMKRLIGHLMLYLPK